MKGQVYCLINSRRQDISAFYLDLAASAILNRWAVNRLTSSDTLVGLILIFRVSCTRSKWVDLFISKAKPVNQYFRAAGPICLSVARNYGPHFYLL